MILKVELHHSPRLTMTNFAQGIRQTKDADYNKVAENRRELTKTTLADIHKSLENGKSGWVTNDWRDRFFAARVQLPYRWSEGVSEEEKQELLYALYADGWHSVELFLGRWEKAFAELRVLREPIVIAPVDAEPFEATIDPNVTTEDRVREIVNSGVWCYRHGVREFIPPHRIAAVQLRG